MHTVTQSILKHLNNSFLNISKISLLHALDRMHPPTPPALPPCQLFHTLSVCASDKEAVHTVCMFNPRPKKVSTGFPRLTPCTGVTDWSGWQVCLPFNWPGFLNNSSDHCVMKWWREGRACLPSLCKCVGGALMCGGGGGGGRDKKWFILRAWLSLRAAFGEAVITAAAAVILIKEETRKKTRLRYGAEVNESHSSSCQTSSTRSCN